MNGQAVLIMFRRVAHGVSLPCGIVRPGRHSPASNQPSLNKNMPTIHDLKKSRFLTKEDCGKGILVTIRGYHKENVAPANESAEEKWLLDFEETDKPLVLNSTRGQIIAGIVGSEDFQDWITHRIVLFQDPNISMGGKLVGGIGVRAMRVRPDAIAPIPPTTPKPAPKPVPAPKPAPMPVPVAVEAAESGDDDDVPF